MVNQAGSSTTASTTGGLNVATIGGQPVILASKAQGTMAGQVSRVIGQRNPILVLPQQNLSPLLYYTLVARGFAAEAPI
jgi:hypothetical protein